MNEIKSRKFRPQWKPMPCSLFLKIGKLSPVCGTHHHHWNAPTIFSKTKTNHKRQTKILFVFNNDDDDQHDESKKEKI